MDPGQRTDVSRRQEYQVDAAVNQPLEGNIRPVDQESQRQAEGRCDKHRPDGNINRILDGQQGLFGLKLGNVVAQRQTFYAKLEDRVGNEQQGSGDAAPKNKSARGPIRCNVL